jgi:hypothetical protein
MWGGGGHGLHDVAGEYQSPFLISTFCLQAQGLLF